MAARQRKQPEPEPITPEQLPGLKAAEFSRLARQTGWRLAWLVVSSAEPGTAGRPSEKSATSGQLKKVTLNQFAKLAGVGRSTVQYYYKAWEFAYQDSVVPCPAVNVPIDVEWQDGQMIPPDEFQLDDDDLAHPWSFYFDWAKYNQRPNPSGYEEDSEEEESSEPEESDNVVDGKFPVAEDETDESDSVDEDFGIEPESKESESIAQRLEKQDQADKLHEVLDSVRLQIERVSGQGEISSDNYSILTEIVSAAEDLKIMAQAMINSSEKVA